MVKRSDDEIRLGSIAEDLFIEIFSDVFGPEKTKCLFIQYPIVDIYGRNRFIDFALESGDERIHLKQKQMNIFILNEII